MVYKAKPVEQVFWTKVDKRAPDECWPWTGSKRKTGYGLLNLAPATHIALALDGRPKPEGMFALHSCDNPVCVNPAHLRWGTDAENVADMVSRKRHQANRREHCIHGHLLDGDNLLVRKNGHRGCRTCQRKRNADYKRRRRMQNVGQ